MVGTNLRSQLERTAVSSFMRAPRSVREALSIPSRTSDGVALDDQVRLLLGLEKRAKIPRWQDVPLDVARRHFARSGDMLAPRSVEMETRDLALDTPETTLRARLYRPFTSTAASPALVYFHGGGFVLGNIESHDSVCRALALAANCHVLSVEYRLAPEHKYPTPVDDAVAAFRAVVARADGFGIDRARMAVGGDSAGGYLAAQVAIRTKLAGDNVKPMFQVLIYPAADMTMASPSLRELGDGLLLEFSTIQWFHAHFLRADADRASGELSPASRSLDELRGVAPAHIQTAGFDPLRDEGVALADRLKEAGVEVEHKNYGSLVHGYLNIAGVIEAAMLPYYDAGSALKAAFRGPVKKKKG